MKKQTLTSPSVIAPPVRVLFFYLDYGAIGGIERYILEVATRLKQRGRIEPIVACSASGWLQRPLQEQGITVHGIESNARWSGSIWRMLDFSALKQLFQVLQQERPGIIHVHIGLLENLWLKWLGYPIVYTVHGYSTLYTIPEGLSLIKATWKRLVRLLFRKTTRHMDQLLFVSQSEQDRMLDEGFITESHPASVLHNGVDIKPWQNQVASLDINAIKAKLNVPKSARVVSFINRLDPNKNPLHFVELAKILLADPDYQDVHFLIAGNGLQAGLVRLHALFSPQVHVLGYYPNVAELITVSDLIIYPSEREGFGLGLLEAMAAGRLCLAYESGGAKEILDTPDTKACLIPVGSLQLLTAKAKTCLNLSNPERQELCQALMQRAEAFDINTTLTRLESVYSSIQPLVSVILPVYQGEETILRAVDSVLKQQYPHLELIVVDDGSTDQTLAKLERITDPRLKVLKQANQGVAKARNNAYTHANGEYIAFIDADDVWLPNKLTEELRVIQQADNLVCLVYSSYYAVNEQNTVINLPAIRTQSGDVSQVVLEDEGLFLPSTALVHRHVFEAVGGFQASCYHEDRVFFIKAAQQFPAYPTQKRLVLYQQSLSGRCRRILQDYQQALHAELSIIDTLQEALSPSQLALLQKLQLRNLLLRFLMYGYLDSARQVETLLSSSQSRPEALLTGKKGALAWLSLRLDINFLAGLRLCMQQGVYPFLRFSTQF